MAIHRGIQSAIFYYLSCAPCTEARIRKKRKQDAVRGRADREALYAEIPNSYRHPSPSSTNPYWQSEISAGPALMSRGGKKKNATNTSLGSGGRKVVKSSMTQRSDGSNRPSSADVNSTDGRIDSKVHVQQFQREDEPWIPDASDERLGSSSTLDGSARSRITRPPKAKMAEEGSFSSHRNPMINDLHPATVTNIGSREEARWLMAPPPTAAFMSGKEPASRSRSDSGGSRVSSRSGVPLSREMSRRMIEQKTRNGEAPLTPTLSRESTLQVPGEPDGQRHDRSRTDEIDFALEDSPSNRGKRRPFAVQTEDSTGSTGTIIRSPDLVPEPIRARKVASRPQLSTIVSDSMLQDDEDFRTRPMTPKENVRHSDNSVPEERNRIDRRSAVLVKDDPSLKVLQDLAPASRILKAQVVSPEDLATHAKRTRGDSRHPNSLQDVQQQQQSDETTGGADMYDSWYTPDFALPDWIHEHTKREVTERWSMDF
ncbi:hypothetical protein LTR37_016933 [Vermiconidia calcicola]|uniref:Uncharacterized protein n=1 Tax=Vermiconidia calcicola TaxID=1690605 RepID=A0ACC3MLI9_9PEZI|nr:hypothetical protein LTR37_016933 [Vermiconidia calcicola]